ncbi:RebB family R body protein [Celerinatantimonas sp. YJH-8]|uniref:RebB family R body protein n=1 Tax=Celerinatantimonas sp. YJH-8 TaxID=3228714 RepID=UPI0038C0A574
MSDESKQHVENGSQSASLPEHSSDYYSTLQAFSTQPTTLLETTLSDTLGLSMHNAITNQQQSQMTTSASVTNACARLLKTPMLTNHSSATTAKNSAIVPDEDEINASDEIEQPTPKRLNLFRFLKRKKNSPAAESTPSSKDNES